MDDAITSEVSKSFYIDDENTLDNLIGKILTLTVTALMIDYTFDT